MTSMDMLIRCCMLVALSVHHASSAANPSLYYLYNSPGHLSSLHQPLLPLQQPFLPQQSFIPQPPFLTYFPQTSAVFQPPMPRPVPSKSNSNSSAIVKPYITVKG